MKYAKYLAGVAACAISAGLAWGAGLWQTLPIIGGAAYCSGTNVSGNAQGTITGQGGAAAANGQTTGTSICQSNVPAGETVPTGTEVIPIDLYTPGTQVIAGGPSTEVLPISLLGAGYGALQLWSTTGTGQSATINNGTSNFIYDGSSTATIAFTMPSTPFQNERVCMNNAGGGILTLTVAANTSVNAQSLVQGAAPTSLQQQAASTLASAGYNNICYVYNAASLQWFRLN